MKKLAIFLLCLAFTFQVFAFNLDINDNIDIATGDIATSYSYRNSAVSIFMMGSSVGVCSGVLVKGENGYSYILTCKHCINVTEEMYVGREKENRVIAIMTASDDDLALIKVKGTIEDTQTAKLALFNAKIDEKLYFVGYPNLIFDIYRVQGRVLKYTEDWGWALMEIIPGCSGGGIFNSEQELVGIAWGSDTGLALFEPIEDVWKFLKEVEAF